MSILKSVQKFINIGTLGIQDSEEVKRIRLSNLILFTIFITGTPFTVLFGLYGNYLSGVVLIFYILSFLIVLKFNQLQKCLLSRISMIALMNTAVIHYALWFGADSGLHHMLISFSCVPFLIFKRQHFAVIITGALISIVGFIIVDFVEFTPMLTLDKSSILVVYYSITVVALVWVFLIMIYLFNQNHQAVLQVINQRKERTSDILIAQEEEREFFSRELHDGLGQLLSAIKLDVIREAGRNNSDPTYTIELVDAAVQEMRGIAHRLVPIAFENEGLIQATEDLIAKIRNVGHLEVFFHVSNLNQRNIKKENQINIYRILQEALNNIHKHAQASEVCVQLIQMESSLTITIEDNGKGFTLDEKFKKGKGLQNISARTELMNGELTFDTGSNIGTTIIIVIPLEEIIVS